MSHDDIENKSVSAADASPEGRPSQSRRGFVKTIVGAAVLATPVFSVLSGCDDENPGSNFETYGPDGGPTPSGSLPPDPTPTPDPSATVEPTPTPDPSATIEPTPSPTAVPPTPTPSSSSVPLPTPTPTPLPSFSLPPFTPPPFTPPPSF